MPMERYALDTFTRWFDSYANRFFGADECVNAHLRMKQEHTRRTRAEIVALAGELMLDERQRWVAELVALFHDVGRFPQFARYQTFNDDRSVDHSRLGVEILRQEGVLSVLRREERQWIETAIEHHGRRSLPGGLNGQALLFAKLIRDADKLDIYRIVIERYRQYRADPGSFPWPLELPDEPHYSPAVLDALREGRPIEHTLLQTLNDMILCKLSWVYDMNFAAALVRVREEGFLEQLLAFLPATEEIGRLGEKILAHVEIRVHEGAR
jgi:putative nucleotidyltransferase with HDIG domain